MYFPDQKAPDIFVDILISGIGITKGFIKRK